MTTTDKNMIQLIDILKVLKIIRFDVEFCEAIGLLKQNLVNIKKGNNHFTPEQIRKACLKYEANANWIFGFSDKIFLNHHIDPRLAHTDTKENVHR